MMFLIQAVISQTAYMGRTTRFEDVRIVYAEHEGQAIEKYNQYWQDRCSEYSVSYYTNIVSCNPAIL